MFVQNVTVYNVTVINAIVKFATFSVQVDLTQLTVFGPVDAETFAGDVPFGSPPIDLLELDFLASHIALALELSCGRRRLTRSSKSSLILANCCSMAFVSDF